MAEAVEGIEIGEKPQHLFKYAYKWYPENTTTTTNVTLSFERPLKDSYTILTAIHTDSLSSFTYPQSKPPKNPTLTDYSNVIMHYITKKTPTEFLHNSFMNEFNVTYSSTSIRMSYTWKNFEGSQNARWMQFYIFVDVIND